MIRRLPEDGSAAWQPPLLEGCNAFTALHAAFAHHQQQRHLLEAITVMRFLWLHVRPRPVCSLPCGHRVRAHRDGDRLTDSGMAGPAQSSAGHVGDASVGADGVCRRACLSSDESRDALAVSPLHTSCCAAQCNLICAAVVEQVRSSGGFVGAFGVAAAAEHGAAPGGVEPQPRAGR